jgi:hypothetical protein
MKTNILIILIFFSVAMTKSFASSDTVSILRSEILKNIDLAKVAAEMQQEGAVFAEFIVREDGKIEVLNCHSLQSKLQSYIFEKLSSITITPDPSFVGKTYLMRFDFKLE